MSFNRQAWTWRLVLCAAAGLVLGPATVAQQGGATASVQIAVSDAAGQALAGPVYEALVAEESAVVAAPHPRRATRAPGAARHRTAMPARATPRRWCCTAHRSRPRSS